MAAEVGRDHAAAVHRVHLHHTTQAAVTSVTSLPAATPPQGTPHLHVNVPDLQVDQRELLLQRLRKSRTQDQVLTRARVQV